MFSLVAICCAIGLVRGSAKGYGKNGTWNYKWDTTPQGNWSINYPLCTNNSKGTSRQSPINVKSCDSVYTSMKLETINYTDTKDVYFEMENNDHSICFGAENDNGKVPQAVKFKGNTYRLHQFHFHWGSISSQGSEHQIDSQKFSGEIHIIHFNTKYANTHDAKTKDDGLLVWAHFLKAGSTDGNSQLQKLLDEFSKANVSGPETKVENVNLRSLLPKDSNDFYHYSGSFTTPPCYESIQWIVNKNPIDVTEDQMKVFRTLKDKAMGKIGDTYATNQDNFRKTQPLNNRTIHRNFDSSMCSSGFATKAVDVIMVIFAIVAYFSY